MTAIWIVLGCTGAAEGIDILAFGRSREDTLSRAAHRVPEASWAAIKQFVADPPDFAPNPKGE